MSEVVAINTLEELLPYANEKGIVEIAMRGAHKRFKAFPQLVISNLPQQEQKAAKQMITELLEKNVAKKEQAIGLLKNDLAISNKSLDLIGQVAGMDKFGLLLSGANLCATCAGFAMVMLELKRIESNLSDQIGRLHEDVKKGNDAWSSYDFDKVLSEHNNMLDSYRRQKPYTEEQLRELVDREFNVLGLLIRIFENNIAGDNENLIYSILSLLSMFTAALRYFDEIYYFNNHDNIQDGDWHSSHDGWMSVYTKLVTAPFVQRYQDYAMLEANMNTREADIFYIGMIDQVRDLEQQVRDNQELVKRVGGRDDLQKVKKAIIFEVKRVIEETIEEALDGTEADEIRAAYEKAGQMAVAA